MDDDETVVPALPAVRGGVQLVRTDASWHYQTALAPRISRQIGALAASGLDVVAGRTAALIEVLGDDVPPPAAWPYDVDGRAAGALPEAVPDDARVASLYAVTRFALGRDHEGLRMLEIRARYEDGLAIWINGTEVVREALRRDRANAFATRPHGPEWETFYVPVAPGLLALGDNTLAFEVHPAGRRKAPLLAVDVIGRRDLGIVRGPIVMETGATTVTVALYTDPGLDASIEWGVTTLDHTATSPAGKAHRFELKDLPPRSQIAYRIHAGGGQTPIYHLHTAPAAGDVIRIGVYGDVRGGHATHKQLVDAMLGEGLDLVAVTGDMVLHGSDEADWQRFFTVTGELVAQVPYLPAVGNHDLGWEGAAAHDKRADEVFALPPAPAGRPPDTYWYSYDLADIHLVFLDSNAYERAEQETWLDGDLAAARKRNVRAIFAFTHEPPYSRGLHRGNTLARERYVPILARYKVDLLLAGHDHLYERGEIAGIRYIVSGGGGASLYPISCGVAGKPACKVEDGLQAAFKLHHYLVLSVGKDAVEMCPRRGDGTLVEKCIRYKLAR